MRLTNPNQQLKYSHMGKPFKSTRHTSLKNSQRIQQRSLTRALMMSMVILPLCLLAGCQSGGVIAAKTSAPVIPRENATHGRHFDTYGMGKNKASAIGDAMNNAEITCHKYANTQVIVIDDHVKYNGIVNEKTGAIIDKASQVIGILSGQTLPEASSEDDYEAHITFKCRPMNEQ